MKSNYFKNITYTDKTETPLLWHDFNRFIRVPLGMLQRIGDMITCHYADLHVLVIVSAVLFASMLIFEVDQAKWKKSAYYAIMFSCIGWAVLSTIIAALTNEQSVNILVYIVACIFEVLYYYKRRELFDGIPMKEANTIKNDLISSNANKNDERAVFLENKKNDYIVLRNRLREIKAPGFEELEAKAKQGRELTDYEKRVFETRKMMNVLYDSVNEEKPFGPEYEEAKKLIDKLEDDLKSQ